MKFNIFLGLMLLLSIPTQALVADPPDKQPAKIEKPADKPKPENPSEVVAGGSNKVDGLELPADFSVGYDEGYIIIPAKCTGPVKWLILIQPGTGRIKYSSSDTSNEVITSVPVEGGVIQVFAVGVVNNKPTDFARCLITVEGKVPPNPPPGPNPTPTPVPANSKLFVTVVLDLDKVTPAQAKVLNDADLRNQLSTGGHKFSILDSKSDVVKAKGLDKAIVNNGATLVIQTPNGKVVSNTTLTNNSVDIITLVNKLLGK